MEASFGGESGSDRPAAGAEANVDRSAAHGAATPVPVRDIAIVLFAVCLLVLGNCGVVRALDIALDAMRR